MKSRIVFIIVLLTSNFVWAQKDISIDLFGGVDYNELQPENSSIEVTPRFSPFGGLGLNLPITNRKDFFQGGAMYYMKASKDNRHRKHRSVGLSVFAKYNLALSENAWISLGGQYSTPFESYVLNGLEKKFKSVYKSYFSLNAGIRFMLQKNLSIEASYEYPVGNSYLKVFPNIKLGLALTFDGQLLNLKAKKHNRAVSEQLIQRFKKTALLVSLPSYKYRIEKCLEVGNTKMAQQLREQRDEKNTDLMMAFKTAFDFCPVYFFYNHDTYKVKQRDFEDLFLNDSLKKDANIKFDEKDFLVGKLGYASLDTSQNVSYTDVYKNGFNMAEGYAVSYQSESDFSNYGFIIVNQDFEFLARPFPSHTRGYFLFVRVSYQNLIEKLNEKLHKFYEKSSRLK